MDIKKLFVDFCNGGCIIKTRTAEYEYATKHLPNCLTLVDENISSKYEFVIKSIIPHVNKVSFFTSNYDKAKEYIYKAYKSRVNFRALEYTRTLNNIIRYVNSDDKLLWCRPIPHIPGCTLLLPLEDIYKKNLKSKMIENLMELYFVKFMCISNILSLPEIKIVIVEILFKLDRWNNLEIC